jgi:hypothetical protein
MEVSEYLSDMKCRPDTLCCTINIRKQCNFHSLCTSVCHEFGQPWACYHLSEFCNKKIFYFPIDTHVTSH